jgi:electron transfer flavoprotein alpha subunit
VADPGYAPEQKLALLQQLLQQESPHTVLFADRGERRPGPPPGLSRPAVGGDRCGGNRRRWRAPSPARCRFQPARTRPAAVAGAWRGQAKLPFVGKGERLQTAALPAVSEQVQDLAVPPVRLPSWRWKRPT